MAGQPSSYTPSAPAGAPIWAATMMQTMVQWVERKLSGPLRLTKYAANDRPSAGSFARALIFDSGASQPMCSDDLGNWKRIAAYASGIATGTTSGTLNGLAGKFTTGALSTVAGAGQVITISNSLAAAADMVMASVQNGSNTAGTPVIGDVAVSAGAVAVDLRNTHASAAFNGSFVISFLVLKA